MLTWEEDVQFIKSKRQACEGISRQDVKNVVHDFWFCRKRLIKLRKEEGSISLQVKMHKIFCKSISLTNHSRETWELRIYAWHVNDKAAVHTQKGQLPAQKKWPLKVVSATFLLVSFVSLKESTCETRKNLSSFVLKIIKFWLFRYSDVMMASIAKAGNMKCILLNNFASILSLVMKFGQFM